MADFDKIKINGVTYNVTDTATSQAVVQVASDLAETDTTVQQQSQQIAQQGQQIAQQGQQIAQQGQQIADLSERVGASSPQYIAVVGDSYGTGEVGPVTGWPTLLAQYLGKITGTDFFQKSIGGSGFTKTAGLSWNQIVQDLASEMGTDACNNTAKVLFAGGYNDNTGMSEGALARAIGTAKSLFKNAQIYVACIGWSNDPGMSVTIANNVVPVYQKAPKYGAIYIQNSEYSLHNYTWFQPDGFHPTQEGENHIAEMLAQGLKTGSCDNTYPLSQVSFTSGSILQANITGWAIIKNEITFLLFNNSVELKQQGDNIPISSAFELGTLNCDYVRGIDNFGYLAIANEGFFTYSGSEYNSNMTLSLQKGKIVANILARIPNQPSTANVSGFYINMHGCAFPTMYV